MKIINQFHSLSLLVLFTGVVLSTACQEETIDPVPQSFMYPNFENSYGLNILGSAYIVKADNKSVLRLTDSYYWQKGGCWYGRSKMQVAKGFETSFSFRLSGTDPIRADGFAFVIQNVGQDSLGIDGAGLGYDGLPNSLAVEFDTYQNWYIIGDENDNHISIHTNGRGPNSVNESASIASTKALAVNLKDGDTYLVRITYDPGTLTIYLNNQQVLSASVNLEEMLELSEGGAYIGFTAATGLAYQNHDIISWSYSPK